MSIQAAPPATTDLSAVKARQQGAWSPALDDDGGMALQTDIDALLAKFNVARDGTLVIPSEYLEVVITRRN